MFNKDKLTKYVIAQKLLREARANVNDKWQWQRETWDHVPFYDVAV